MVRLIKGVQGSGFGARGSCPEPTAPSPEPRGFTFVELMIAATMISVLFVGLGAHLRGGLTVWQRATATTETLQRHRVAFDRLERDLANALVYDDQPSSYGAVKGQLPTPQFGADTLGVYTVSTSTTQPSSAVRWVTYTCERIDGIPGLWRRSQSVAEARGRNPQPTPELVLPGCEALSFHYAYVSKGETAPEGLEWKSAWPDNADHALKPPRLVEASVQVSGRSVHRVCAIPIGLLGVSE